MPPTDTAETGRDNLFHDIERQGLFREPAAF